MTRSAPLVPRLLDDGGRPLLEIPDGLEILLTSHLTTGLGSSGLTFDRGMQGRTQRVRFERRGRTMTLVQLNKRWTARGDSAQQAVGTDSFVRSIIWSALVEREVGDVSLVDATALILRDHLGIADHLLETEQGRAVLDPARCFVDLETSSSHESHVELSAQVTFAVDRPGELLIEVAPDPHSLTFGLRLTLMALPTGFEALPFDPAAGGYGKGFEDASAEPSEGTTVLLQPRFRVTPDRTIVFEVDPGIPEPYRSAVVTGGAWWADAFASAGLPGAFQVRVMPPETDPFAAGTNVVWWIHRTGRGWSRAAASVDVRTGEILHANVRLGSQRVHQLSAMLEALLSPYGRDDEAERLASIRRTVLLRLQHLAAHEIGHALGFVHNYASTSHAIPSVMDYPHPRLGVLVDDEGRERVDLDDAYTPSLGEWDHELVRRAYGAPSPGPRPGSAAFISDLDGHGPDASSPDGVPWTFGADPVRSLRVLLDVRRVALTDFGPGALAPGRQLGELEGRFFLVHLLHRHQVTAVARLVGGAGYRYGRHGSAAAGTITVETARQWEALESLVPLLEPTVLSIPRRIAALMTPPSLRYRRSADAVAPAAGPVFDSARAVEAAAGIVVEPMLSAGRLNRLWEQHRVDGRGPDVADVIARLGGTAFEADADAIVVAGRSWAFTRHAVAACEHPGLHPWVRAEVVAALAELGSSSPRSTALAAVEALRSWLRDGGSEQIGSPLAAPPGAPL